DPNANVVLIEPDGRRLISEDQVIQAMDGSVHTVFLSQVAYHTGQLLDVRRIAAAARSRGILIGLDCSHSIGVMPHRLRDVDFAVWCSYKYLCGGPGAAAGLFLNRRHAGAAPGLPGWFGLAKDRQFDMSAIFQPAGGAAGLQIGTPNVLSMAPLAGALNLLEEAGIDAVREKSLAQTGYMIELSDLFAEEMELITPREPERRGSHISLTHPEAVRICGALKAVGVIPDYRPPDIVRLAASPLYTSFTDCFEAMVRLRAILDEGTYRSFPAERHAVP
ncbi:MAG TPA: aminotransferase class V-fold PLP-dependent enzyme, partial [Chthonomonadales bacterium]|nr:aminotransferase class V-fold PLP-dependent enzyme [Chthonomonadales bacterium]